MRRLGFLVRRADAARGLLAVSPRALAWTTAVPVANTGAGGLGGGRPGRRCRGGVHDDARERSPRDHLRPASDQRQPGDRFTIHTRITNTVPSAPPDSSPTSTS